MATLITGIAQAKVLSNLDTYNHTTLLTSMYKVVVQATEIPPSGLEIVIQQNGTPMATAALPAATQSHVELQVRLNCTAGDVISTILSSASITDTDLNTVRATLAITAGPT
jgi:hypothetical protein